MRLATVFSDNMVLQAEKPLRIFGFGAGDISLRLNGAMYESSFSGDKWVWELPSQPYGGPYDMTVVMNGVEKIIKNVAFGDVFLCSGPSNMGFTISEEVGAAPAVKDEKIRYYLSNMSSRDTEDTVRNWGVCLGDNVSAWSALGLQIAENHRKKRDVYIGILACYRGCAAMRSWLPERKLDGSIFVPLELRHRDYRAVVEANNDSYLYTHNFSPIVPLSFKSVVWYQGESDTTLAEAEVYTEMLARMIDAWREDLMDSNLPFVVIEICDFDPRDDEAWHKIQACQREVAGIRKNVTVVTSKDVCEHTAIHPANKEKLAAKVAAVI